MVREEGAALRQGTYLVVAAVFGVQVARVVNHFLRSEEAHQVPCHCRSGPIPTLTP